MSSGSRSRFAFGAAALAASVGILTGTAAVADDTHRVPEADNYYIALGDSFTSAPLISRPVGEWGEPAFSDPQTWGEDTNGPIDCGKSDLNYPHQLAQHLGVFDPLAPASLATHEHTHETHPGFIDISCGGAETEDMEGRQSAAFDWKNPRQFDAFDWVDDPSKITLVTLGIGGNDLGFGELQDKCVEDAHAPDGEPCNEYYSRDEDGDGLDVIDERLEELRPKLATVIDGIKERAPRAEILVFGYPALLPEAPLAEGLPEGCYPYIPLLAEDVPYLRSLNKRLNQAIAEVAAKKWVHFVDWYTPSIGHDMCQPPGVAWVNGLVLVPPSFPVHPNVLGTTGAADAAIEVLDAIDFDFSVGRSYPGRANGCQDPDHPGEGVPCN